MSETRSCRLPVQADSADFLPLIEHLERDQPVMQTTPFPRGTLTSDGRLDLCKQDVGPANLSRIADALKNNTFVKSLLLGADALGDEGAVHVARLLEENGALETVFLGCNGIAASGIERICAAAAGNPRLRGLWLKRNKVGRDGARHVARLLRTSQSLRTLDLDVCEIDGESLRPIVRAICERGVLERLYLCGNALDDSAATVLAELAGGPIRELYLGCNRLGDEGIRNLGEAARELHILGLQSNGISPQGARALSTAIEQSATLHCLELGQARSMSWHRAEPNRVGDEGALALANALQHNVSLKSLRLGGNGIGEIGAAAFLSALATNRNLSCLEIGGNVSRECRRSLRDALARTPRLSRVILYPPILPRFAASIAPRTCRVRQRSCPWLRPCRRRRSQTTNWGPAFELWSA